jgi:hypothetical protein
MDMEAEFEERSEVHLEKFHKLETYGQMESKFRMVAIVHDRMRFPTSIGKFKELARSMANREDLRVGLITEREPILKILR